MRPIKAVLEDFVPLNEQQKTVRRELRVYIVHYVSTIDKLQDDVMRLEKLVAEVRVDSSAGLR